MITELYNIKRNSKIYCDLSDGSTYLIFNNLDGMYSHCTTEKGNTIHLKSTTPIKHTGKRKNEYTILEQ